jgi:hypothetical protein
LYTPRLAPHQYNRTSLEVKTNNHQEQLPWLSTLSQEETAKSVTHSFYFETCMNITDM